MNKSDKPLVALVVIGFVLFPLGLALITLL